MWVRFRTREDMQHFITRMCDQDRCIIGDGSPLDNVELKWEISDRDLPLKYTVGMPLTADRPRYMDEIWVTFPQEP